MYTVIDSDNYAAAGIETMFFPGGEPHVKVPKLSKPVLLYLKLRTWADVGIAACLMSAVAYQTTFNAFIPYFPGARQDRSDGWTPLTVSIMADLLGKMQRLGFVYRIGVFDPHSGVLSRYLDFTTLMPLDLVMTDNLPVTGVIAPDVGALARATQFRNAFYPHANLIECTKSRDSQTGRLSNYNLPKLQRAGRYVVADDICDGGGTFNLLADAFSADPLGSSSRLELFVSHGIFSRGLENISAKIEHITTTDSWCQLKNSERLTVLPLAPLFNKIMGAASA